MSGENRGAALPTQAVLVKATAASARAAAAGERGFVRGGGGDCDTGGQYTARRRSSAQLQDIDCPLLTLPSLLLLGAAQVKSA